jgi:hypothetical protein
MMIASVPYYSNSPNLEIYSKAVPFLTVYETENESVIVFIFVAAMVFNDRT